MLWKCCTQYARKFGKQQWPQNWKRSVFIPVPKKGNAKECSNYCTIALISHTSKVMLKILQARLQQYVNCEIPDVQAGFRKGRGTRDQIANIHWIIEKAREFQRNIYFCFIDPTDVGNLISVSSAFSKFRLNIWKFTVHVLLKPSLENCERYSTDKLNKQGGHRTGKCQFFIPIPKKGNVKECSNYCTIVLISHASKVLLKILQARLQQYVNHELPHVQAAFRKGRGTRHQIANIRRAVIHGVTKSRTRLSN